MAPTLALVDPNAPPAPIPGWDGRSLEAVPAKLSFPEGNALRWLCEPDSPEVPIKCLDCDEMVTTSSLSLQHRCGLEKKAEGPRVAPRPFAIVEHFPPILDHIRVGWWSGIREEEDIVVDSISECSRAVEEQPRPAIKCPPRTVMHR